MKKTLALLMIISSLFGFIGKDSYRQLRNNSFEQGEQIKYRVHYGFINAGEATLKVNPELYKVKDKVCYHIVVNGRTTGAFDKMLRIRDTWGSYVDTSQFVPHKAYRNIEEGRYRKKEETTFEHKQKFALIEDPRKQDEKGESIKIVNNTLDIVSSYYYLRLLDYSKMKIGDTIKINAVFEDSLYKMKIRYKGRETLKTEFGKINAIVLAPVMPENKLFDGREAVRMWLSDDLNKIPLKIQANLFVGALELDIKSYNDLRHPIQFNK